MTDWSKFKGIDAKALNAESESLGSGDFPEIPNGKYEVILDEMELKPTKKKGDPMLAVQFTILEGEYKNQKIFYNQVILMGDENDKYRVHTANEFLRSLESSKEISFEGVEEYEALINDVYDEVADGEFLLEITENKNGYKQYKIKEVF